MPALTLKHCTHELALFSGDQRLRTVIMQTSSLLSKQPQPQLSHAEPQSTQRPPSFFHQIPSNPPYFTNPLIPIRSRKRNITTPISLTKKVSQQHHPPPCKSKPTYKLPPRIPSRFLLKHHALMFQSPKPTHHRHLPQSAIRPTDSNTPL